MIPAVKGKPSYHEPVYDKMWAALEELNLPVGVHSGADDEPLAIESGIPLHAQVCDNKMFMMQRSLALLITSAVPQRFPKLRFVIVEGGIGWIAAQLRFMDHWWEDHHRWMEPRLEEPPSAYYQRQFWATFEDDRAGILTRHLLNIDHLMWGSDYPHTEGTFPFRWTASGRISVTCRRTRRVEWCMTTRRRSTESPKVKKHSGLRG
jgi:uncharacterized protein